MKVFGVLAVCLSIPHVMICLFTRYAQVVHFDFKSLYPVAANCLIELVNL